MNEKHLSCEIVKDLIPLCSEGLCSEESRAAIEAHVSECESCRRLYEQLPEVAAPQAPIPDESKAFRKVNKKLKARLAKLLVLGTVLLLVLGGLGYLSIGQVMKIQGQQSFETVWQSIEVHRLAKMLGKGDIEGYMKYASVGDLFDTVVTPMDMQSIRMKETEALKDAFQKAYGGEIFDHVSVHSYYGGAGQMDATVPVTEAFIYFKSGLHFDVQFVKNKDNLYSGYISGVFISSEDYPREDATEEERHFRQIFNYVEYHGLYPQGWLRTMLTNSNPVEGEKAKFRVQFLTNYIAPAWHDGIEERLTAFYEKGYLITDFNMTCLYYDKEKEMLYHELTIAAEDAQGTAVLMTRLYSDAYGCIPAPETDRIYTDNCTDELAADLDALFG